MSNVVNLVVEKNAGISYDVSSYKNNFPDNVDNAKKLFELWEARPHLPCLIVSGPQQGKTGTNHCFVNLFINKVIKETGNPYAADNISVYLWGPAHNTLENQNTDRFEKFTYYDSENDRASPKMFKNVLGGYHTWAKKSDNDEFIRMLKARENQSINGVKKDYVLILVDEAHMGQRDNVNAQFKKIHDEIKLDKHTVLVYTTATPSCYLTNRLTPEAVLNEYNLIYLEPSKDYLSFRDLLDQGRIIDYNSRHFKFKVSRKSKDIAREEIEVKQSTRRFCNEIIQRDIIDMRSSYCGDMVVRVLDTESAINLKKAIEGHSFYHNTSGDAIKTQVTIYASDPLCAPIYQLNKDLADRGKLCLSSLSDIHFRIIIGGYKQGDTFEDMSTVRLWFEYVNNSVSSNYTNIAGHVQSVGRNLGRPKHKLDYPIYCNKKVIVKVANYYDELSALQKGQLAKDHEFEHISHMSGGGVSKKSRRKKKSFDVIPEIGVSLHFTKDLSDISDFIIENLGKEATIKGKTLEELYSKDPRNAFGASKNSISQNNLNDVVKDVILAQLPGQRYHTMEIQGAYAMYNAEKIDRDERIYMLQVFVLDGPNSNYLNSYNEMKQKYQKEIEENKYCFTIVEQKTGKTLGRNKTIHKQ